MNDEDLREVSRFCALIGSDPLLVQGPGGNVSWKEYETIWVTASGTWLADARRKDIFLPIRRTSGIFDAISNDLPYEFELLNSASGRPSIETVLHCLHPQRFVLHLHAINPLALLVREDAEPALAEKLTGEVPYIFVPYAKPGHQLGRMVASRLGASQSSCELLLLANHGIVIAAETIDEVSANLRRVCAAFEPDKIYRPKPMPAPLSPLEVCGTIYNPVSEHHLHTLATDHRLFTLTTMHWALYPDHVVFLGPKALAFDSADQAMRSKVAVRAPFIFIKGSGVWQRSDVTLTALTQLQCYYDVLIRLDEASRPANLTEQQIEELLDWDAEKHRQGLNQ